MKKTFILSLFLAFVYLIAFTAKTEAATSVAYTYKSSLEDISCAGNNCVAIGNNVILRSTNKGVTWKVALAKKLLSPDEGSSLLDVDCAANICIAVGSRALMLRSSDSGKTWKVIDNFLVALNQDSFTSNISGVDCIDKNICYAIGRNFHHGGDITKLEQAFGTVILKTADGGLTWKIERTQKETASLAYPYSNLLPTTDPDIFEKTYTADEEPPLVAIQKIVCKNEMECYGIGTQRSIMRTTDGWKTATLQQFKIDNPIKVLTNGPNDPNSFGYVVEQNIVNTPQKVSRHDFTGIGFTADGGIMVENMGDGNHFIFKSTDNGVTWQNINVPLPQSSRNGGGRLACYKSICVIVAQNLSAKKIDILTSLNNGNSWTAKTFKKTTSITGVACPDSKSCFAVGDTIPKGVVIKVR